MLNRSEKFRSRKYIDKNGFVAIGYGHRLLHPESFADGIDQPLAADILASDVRDAEQAVELLVKVSLTQGQFDALVDLCFNLGEAKLASSTLLKVLNRGRYQAAVEQLLCWDVAGGDEDPALTARRQAESELWHAVEEEQQVAA